MAFESLTDKLQNVFKNLRSKGRLTEADVKEAMKEVKRALLEADVNFRVVKSFVKTVTDRAIGQDVLTGLNPGQMVIKIVKEEMESLMGSEMTELVIKQGNEITVFLMAALILHFLDSLLRLRGTQYLRQSIQSELQWRLYMDCLA